jgi:cardiolipin synthase
MTERSARGAAVVREQMVSGRTESDAWHFRARDLVLSPGLVSLSRLVFAAVFPFVVGSPLAALALLLVSGLSDVLDGWIARRYGLATATGAALDAVTDKIFIITVAVTLVATGRLSVPAVLLLSTRELGEAPLVVWLVVSYRARARQAEHPKANVPGKLATTLQFVSVALAIARHSALGWFTAATAVAGAFAAVTYWKRGLHRV